VECPIDEVEMMERTECLVTLVGFVDRVRWVNRVEWQGVVELDMQELVEVMTEVQVGSVDWAMCPEAWMDFGSWICSTYKLPTVAW
jgi:hypothetical protein